MMRVALALARKEADEEANAGHSNIRKWYPFMKLQRNLHNIDFKITQQLVQKNKTLNLKPSESRSQSVTPSPSSP